jgi:SulP family sulfate permease
MTEAAAQPSQGRPPLLRWAADYGAEKFSDDALAAVIVATLLIPQSLAYALVAGLPPETGLYASIAPLFAYALFGTSSALAVGPVAVVSLMTATAIGRVAEPGSADYLLAAVTLAALSGVILLALGIFRLGALANFLSHPVMAGFIAASGLLIAAGQAGRLAGIDSGGATLPEIARAAGANWREFNLPTAAVGGAALALLVWMRAGLRPLLVRLGVRRRVADLAARAGPVLAVAATTAAAALLDLENHGVAVVGAVPKGLPPLTPPVMDFELIGALAGPALLISVIGFVESASIAQTLAAKRRQRVDPDEELIALGAANIAAGATGGFPVTGGFARSVVNYDAGARTPAAGAMAGALILVAALYLTPLIAALPKATLAAAIIVAVLSIVDLRSLPRTWRYAKSDGAAMAATIALTLLFGVETGIAAGVALSLALHIRRTSAPHSAVVGQVPGGEHFRNIERHRVVVSPKVVTLRIDESLYFANARFLEDRAQALVAAHPGAEHLILLSPAINDVDASGLEALERVNARLKDAGVKLHLSEVKGPVMDRLRRSDFLDHLTGRVFLTQFGAMSYLDPETTRRARDMAPVEPFAEEISPLRDQRAAERGD